MEAPSEQCDDPGSQCCTSACQFVSNGQACSDNNACTTNDVCTNGVCSGSGCGALPNAIALFMAKPLHQLRVATVWLTVANSVMVVHAAPLRATSCRAWSVTCLS